MSNFQAYFSVPKLYHLYIVTYQVICLSACWFLIQLNFCSSGHTLPHPAAFYDVHGKADGKRGRSPDLMHRCPRASTQA